MVVIEINGATTIYLLFFVVLVVGVCAEPIAGIGNWLVRMRHAGAPKVYPINVPPPTTEIVISEDGIPNNFWSEIEP
jgi:hypothetical protein